MQYRVLDVLLYLFGALVDDKKTSIIFSEAYEALELAGFSKKEIQRSIKWLKELMVLAEKPLSYNMPSIRYYTKAEEKKISLKSRGFLLKLEQLGVIDVSLREIIIQKLMLLDEDVIFLDDLKWIVLMAIFNQPDREMDVIWLINTIRTKQGALIMH